MSGSQNGKVGRPRVLKDGASVTFRLEASQLEEADKLASDMAAVMSGVQLTRGDVLRAALKRGIETMRDEVDARLKR